MTDTEDSQVIVSINVPDTPENRKYYENHPYYTVHYYQSELPELNGYLPHVIHHSHLDEHSEASLLHLSETLHKKGKQLIRNNANGTLDVIHPTTTPPPTRPKKLLN